MPVHHFSCMQVEDVDDAPAVHKGKEAKFLVDVGLAIVHVLPSAFGSLCGGHLAPLPARHQDQGHRVA